MSKPPGGRLLRKKRLRKKYLKGLQKRCFEAIDWVAKMYEVKFGWSDILLPKRWDMKTFRVPKPTKDDIDMWRSVNRDRLARELKEVDFE